MDNNYSILARADLVHVVEMQIIEPNGDIYKKFSTDSADGSGDSFSIATSKGFDAPPTQIANIHTSRFSQRLAECGQVMGWAVRLFAVSRNNTTEVSRVPLQSGAVGSVQLEGIRCAIEVVPQISVLDKQPAIKLLNNCPLVFGAFGCGVPRSEVRIAVTGANEDYTELDVAPTFYSVQSGWQMAIVIGSTSYRVLSLDLDQNGAAVRVVLDRSCKAQPDVVYLVKTCDQSLRQCEVYNNTVKYRGCVLPSSALSITT